MVMTTESPGTRATTRRSAAETGELVLAAAAELFYRQGVRATGVDAVAARAQVAPTTMYRLFPSKDALVAAYVERCSAAYKQQLTAASSPSAGTSQDRILAVIDVFTDEALSEACRGCPFQMVLAEFPDPQSAPHRHAVAHKEWVRSLFRDLVQDLGPHGAGSDPDTLADQLTLIADGIYSSAQALGASGPARHGRVCAEALLRLATEPRRPARQARAR